MVFLTDISNSEEVIVLDTLGQYKLLMSYGIFKGSKLKILRNDRWQELMLVELNGKRIAIRKEDAKPIKVQQLNGE